MTLHRRIQLRPIEFTRFPCINSAGDGSDDDGFTQPSETFEQVRLNLVIQLLWARRLVIVRHFSTLTSLATAVISIQRVKTCREYFDIA